MVAYILHLVYLAYWKVFEFVYLKIAVGWLYNELKNKMKPFLELVTIYLLFSEIPPNSSMLFCVCVWTTSTPLGAPIHLLLRLYVCAFLYAAQGFSPGPVS